MKKLSLLIFPAERTLGIAIMPPFQVAGLRHCTLARVNATHALFKLT
ncbi:MAG: hypothetical protein ABUK01_04680 [Leptospirales bacterium]